jgi:DNA-binding beta-propeller fold protein YncE
MTRPRLSISVAIILAAALIASCSGTASPASPSSSAAIRQGPSTLPGAWLVVGRPGQRDLEVIDAATAERFMPLPLGVPDARWGRFVQAAIQGNRTTVSRLDVSRGDDGSGIALDGKWQLPTIGSDPTPVGLAADDSTVVLVESDTSTSTRAASRFAVVDLSGHRVPKVINLQGSFDFDAISPDGATLFVVEHLDANARYQVRAVDVASGRMQDGVIVDKANPGESMAGWAIEQQRLAGGIVMTLYRGVEHPFIHALSTVDGFAICIDLPPTRHDDADAAADWGLARSPDGRAVYAVNATIGLAVDVNPGDLSIRRSATMPPGTAAIILAKFGHEDPGVTGRRIVVSPDGERIYAASRTGIVELATRDLSVTRRLLSGTRVDSLGVTRDGAGLFALRHSDGRVVRLDVASGDVVAEVPASGYDRLLAVVPLPQE